jgi:hypothetical protein
MTEGTLNIMTDPSDGWLLQNTTGLQDSGETRTSNKSMKHLSEAPAAEAVAEPDITDNQGPGATDAPFPGTSRPPTTTEPDLESGQPSIPLAAPQQAAATISHSTLADVEKLVNLHYAGLLPSVKCGLAVFGAMSLQGRTKPLAVVFETTSGYGKSAIVQMFFPTEGSALTRYSYRCDKFTPKSFVSHVAGTPESGISKIDMLPQIKGKVLLTKELSPIFRGRDDDLNETFAILIPILDGKGFTSNSGSKGRRGYEYDIVFNWLGATTPLPGHTYRLMYQLGTRLLFWEVPSIVPDENALFEYAKRDDISVGEIESQKAVNSFLIAYFNRHPVGSVAPDSISIPDEQVREIARWAQFVANGRREIRYEKNGKDYEPISASKPEGPYKIVNYFKELARGHALIHDRLQVESEDVELVGHAAISSIPGHLRPIVSGLRQNGQVSSSECEGICNVTRPTARRYLLEASLLGFGTLTKGSSASNSPDILMLSVTFSWLRNLERKM